MRYFDWFSSLGIAVDADRASTMSQRPHGFGIRLDVVDYERNRSVPLALLVRSISQQL